MPVRLILLRHGETDWNAEDRYQGRTDVDLNATGQRQARAAVARFLAGALEDADELVAVASPLTRARRTAEIVLEAAVGDAELTLDPDLMELYGGDWEGLRLAEIAERWPAEHEAWRGTPDLDAGPVAGETLRAGGQRVLAALGEHVPPTWTPARGAGERARRPRSCWPSPMAGSCARPSGSCSAPKARTSPRSSGSRTPALWCSRVTVPPAGRRHGGSWTGAGSCAATTSESCTAPIWRRCRVRCTVVELPARRTDGKPSANAVETPFFGGMAQLVARLHGMQKVRGSNPLTST